ncbi:MAG: tetratricopeptide repeat protein [Deinococcales bacterium]
MSRLYQWQPDARKLIEALLAARLYLYSKVIELAPETGQKLPDVLADVLSQSPQIAFAFSNLDDLPKESIALRRLAVVITQQALEMAELLGDKGLQSNLRNTLAVRLGALGDDQSVHQALERIQQSVESYRNLAEKDPDAFLPDLAMSLNNLGNMLRDVGEREGALTATQEAVAIRRQLAQSRPDAFLPDLASSLNNLGNMLSAVGEREGALTATQEGVAIRRQLAQSRPDAFLPDLAGSLNNLGTMLRDGRREGALRTQEGVAIRRQGPKPSRCLFAKIWLVV